MDNKISTHRLGSITKFYYIGCLSVKEKSGVLLNIWTVEGVPVELKMGLFYVDINGSRQELGSLIVEMTDAWEWDTYVLDVPEIPEEAIGKILGIELQNIAERSSWIHVDNVSLIGEE